jgi:hypothetical protein
MSVGVYGCCFFVRNYAVGEIFEVKTYKVVCLELVLLSRSKLSRKHTKFTSGISEVMALVLDWG